jgi:hypothetical protein
MQEGKREWLYNLPLPLSRLAWIMGAIYNANWCPRSGLSGLEPVCNARLKAPSRKISLMERISYKGPNHENFGSEFLEEKLIL